MLLRLRAGAGAFLGLLVLAAHPALADSVAWISGRTSMVSCLGGTLALAAATARRPAPLALGVALALLAGLLGKEDAVVFALPALLIAGRRSRSALAACALGVAAALAAYGALRASALGAALPHAPHAPLASVPLAARLPYGGRAVLEGLRLLVWPLHHPPSYRGSDGFSPGAPPGVLAWAGWIAWLAVVAGGLRARGLAGASAVLAALAALPVLQLVPAGEVFAPRFLYLPLVLGVPAAGALLARLPRPALALVLVLGLPLAVLGAWHRAGVYASRASYARAVLDHAPGDAGSWNDLGLALLERGDPAGARDAWLRAVEHDPDHGRAWDNLGALALAEGDELGAEEHLRRAVAAAPANPIPLCNLASLYLRTGLVPEAASCYAPRDAARARVRAGLAGARERARPGGRRHRGAGRARARARPRPQRRAGRAAPRPSRAVTRAESCRKMHAWESPTRPSPPSTSARTASTWSSAACWATSSP